MSLSEFQPQLLGFCPDCKEAIWFNEDEGKCKSKCVCPRGTDCNDFLVDGKDFIEEER